MEQTWAAPSMWIERIPVLLANKLQLWSKFGLPFKKVRLEICYGGQQTLDIAANKFEIGEIGLFPFVAYNEHNHYHLIGSSFIQQLDHYIVYKHDLHYITNVGVLSKGSCDSFLLDELRMHPTYKHKFNPKGVHKIELQSKYGNAEMLSDANIDAMFLVDPYLSEALQHNTQISIVCRIGELYPRFQWNALFASRQALRENPQKIVSMMEVYKLAVRLMSEFEHDTNIQNALYEIAEKDMHINGRYVIQALRRGMQRWQMDYTQFDFQAAECCLDMMTRIGFTVPKNYCFRKHYCCLPKVSKL